MVAERRVRLSTEAEVDLGQAVGWYEGQRLGLSERFLQSVDEALQRLSVPGSHGSMVPRAPERLQVRRLRLQGFPYFVIFRERGDEVQVLAFAHERRRPSYWRSGIGRAD
ncbi:type II toxin-antitoxin system RelE/ParE family toxin [Hyalangium versicolor]|uniref:type II toxin-antitoxin system RelE/ParE family toxin n=1 Tax=Hyalangium versicolor TaxID=2861190 RepID=UPI001CCF5D99